MRILPYINIDDYNYDLPDERIARHPVVNRDGSKLLLFRNGIISEGNFSNIPAYLPKGSLLVFNDTRVIRARLLFLKPSGVAIEIFCLEPLHPSDYQQSFGTVGPVEWKCLIGNLKKWKTGTLSCRFASEGIDYTLYAQKMEPLGDAWSVKFTWDPQDITFGEVTESAGHIPLPPYLGRDDEKEDYDRYQTVYASVKGSVAAPTAGLHFTDELIDKLKNDGISTVRITLHVGAGTFKPVKKRDISEHEMHCEHYFVDIPAIENLIGKIDRIIAVGTTSVRCLESLYWIGVNIIEKNKTSGNFFTDQWDHLDRESYITASESFGAVLNFMKNGKIKLLHASTKIMILPGYQFRVVKGIVTNFHQPCSTLLLLVSAWCGEKWKEIYKYALENDFRFLSYGDSSLLL
jgi:S-adenosylmethionine:tRNA ribosyltransferase-isomerase